MKKENKNDKLVLIADDNDFVRFLIKKWVGEKAEVVEVANGSEVINTYDARKPNILFLDIHLPGKNGRDILKEVRAHDPEAFIIMVSADSSRDNVVYAVSEGAKAFMTKPFTRQTLDRYMAMCPAMMPENVIVSAPAAL